LELLFWALIPITVLAGLAACLLPHTDTLSGARTPLATPEPRVEPAEAVV
jgi:hypothetical protein